MLFSPRMQSGESGSTQTDGERLPEGQNVADRETQTTTRALIWSSGRTSKCVKNTSSPKTARRTSGIKSWVSDPGPNSQKKRGP